MSDSEPQYADGDYVVHCPEVNSAVPTDMDARKWFNSPSHSNITIKLSDGSEVKVLKFLLCRDNEYFRKLCGPDSQFAESSMDTIELKEDDPAALRGLLRGFYKLPLTEEHGPGTWRFWLNLRTVSDKYLASAVHAIADKNFRETASACENVATILEITQAINDINSLRPFAATLRLLHRNKLLRDDEVRATMDCGDKAVLWRVIDELVQFSELDTRLTKQPHGICNKQTSLLMLPADCKFCRVERCRIYAPNTLRALYGDVL